MKQIEATTTSVTHRSPILRVVRDAPPLNVGPLAQVDVDMLGRHQAVIDLALASGATTVSRDDAPEWARGDDDVTMLLNLTGPDGAPVAVTLAAGDPEWHDGLLVVPTTIHLVDDATSPIVLVEGTANALAVATFAPTDTIVACVTSPRHLASAELQAPGTDELVTGRRVILCTTANPATDRSTHDRVRAASTLLSALGAASVTIINIPTGTPLEFLTGHLTDPSAVLQKLVSDAQSIAKIKAPAARRRAAAGMATFTDGHASLGDFVSTLLGQIVSVTPVQLDDDKKISNPSWQRFAGYRDGEKVFAWRTLLEAAVTVERTIEVLDDLAHGSVPVLRYRLNVQIGAEDGATHHVIEVADGDLSNPGLWRTYLGAEGGAIRIGDGGLGSQGGQRIAEAIRGTITSSTPVDTRIMRTGWWSNGGVARWLDATGGHGSEDKTSAVAAMVHNAAALIDIPPASEFTVGEIQASVRALLDVLDYVDPVIWMTGLAATFYALSGQSPVAVLWWVGDEGAGKSFLLGMLASIVGPKFGPKRGMFKPEATVAAMRASLHECHNVPMWIDDVRQRATANKQQAQDDTVELAIRVGYEGGAGVPAKAEQDTSGKWHPAPVRDSHPFVCVGGEALPPERSVSSIERLLVIPVRKDSSMRPGAKAHLEGLLERQAFAPAAAAFLRDRARTITENHGAELHAARVALSAHTDAVAERWLTADALSAVTPRVREVTRTFLAGAAIFLEFAAECGAISFEDSERTYRRWAKVILTAATNHYAANLESAGVGDQILEAIKGQISAGLRCIGKPADREIPIGDIVKVDGVDYIALIPSEVRKVAQGLGLSGSGLARQMAPVLLVGDSRPERRQRVNGSESMWVFVVRPEKMDPAYYQTIETEGQWGMQVRKIIAPDVEPTPAPVTEPDFAADFDADFDADFIDEINHTDNPNPRATIERIECL
jgi:hypothetical protein